MYTIVSAFFDIGRKDWSGFQRGNDKYFENAKRVFTLQNVMVIFIQPEFVNFVAEGRKNSDFKTVIVPTKIEGLPYYKYVNQIRDIMQSPEFRQGLALPSCPEVCKPLYDVVMWSKIGLVNRAIDLNKFDSTHYVWLDFGVHTHMLQDSMLHKPLLSKVPDEIKFLKLSEPQKSDLAIERFYKSHIVRLAGTMFTGSVENLRLLNQYNDIEVHECLRRKVVDSDQALFNSIYLKHPEIFKLYSGNWGDLISSYYNEH